MGLCVSAMWTGINLNKLMVHFHHDGRQKFWFKSFGSKVLSQNGQSFESFEFFVFHSFKRQKMPNLRFSSEPPFNSSAQCHWLNGLQCFGWTGSSLKSLQLFCRLCFESIVWLNPKFKAELPGLKWPLSDPEVTPFLGMFWLQNFWKFALFECVNVAYTPRIYM